MPDTFGATEERLATEGSRQISPAQDRTWEVQSASRRNAQGEPRAYEIRPGESATPYSSDTFPGLLRAQFARHDFWVTRYRDGEVYPAGDHPNQGPSTGVGLPAFTTPPEPLDAAGDDLVVWYTLGHTHVPRPEDYPVMPTATVRFEIVPHGFFDRNPALDAPDQVR